MWFNYQTSNKELGDIYNCIYIYIYHIYDLTSNNHEDVWVKQTQRIKICHAMGNSPGVHHGRVDDTGNH